MLRVDKRDANITHSNDPEKKSVGLHLRCILDVTTASAEVLDRYIDSFDPLSWTCCEGRLLGQTMLGSSMRKMTPHKVLILHSFEANLYVPTCGKQFDFLECWLL